MKWWRLRTTLAIPFIRHKWQQEFARVGELFSARVNRDYATMAGWYNDHVKGGHMSAEQAKSIYTGK